MADAMDRTPSSNSDVSDGPAIRRIPANGHVDMEPNEDFFIADESTCSPRGEELEQDVSESDFEGGFDSDESEGCPEISKMVDDGHLDFDAESSPRLHRQRTRLRTWLSESSQSSLVENSHRGTGL
mmetsp:Transcript_89893/g.233061  ORF Transcript_89893/g.233061 Transcript_89893/m.233061 type:complete len:126 (+) Transcript_89893:78-455(+)